MRITIYRTLVTVLAIMCFVTGTVRAENACYPSSAEPGVVYNDAVQLFWSAWYNDAFQPVWNVWFNGVTVNHEAVTAGMIGSHAIKVDYEDLWKEYRLTRQSNKLWYTAGKRALVFRVKGIQNKGNGQIWVYVRSPSLEAIGSVPVTDYMVTPPDGWNYDPNTWYTVTIPLSALHAENVIVKEIAFVGGQLAVYGGGNVGTIYLDEIWWVEGLEFPLKGETAYTAKINAVYDHVSSQSEFNCRDEWVVAYSGEVGHSNNTASRWSRITTADDSPPTCVGQILQGYKNGTGTKFSLYGQYDDDPDKNEGGIFLFYDGHTGYDYPKNEYTSVYSVAKGEVESIVGGEIIVDHYNGYKSHYLHVTNIKVGVGSKVVPNVTKLAEVAPGAPHLHLTIKLYGVRVDPYGWSGGFADPSRPFAVNVPLWK